MLRNNQRDGTQQKNQGVAQPSNNLLRTRKREASRATWVRVELRIIDKGHAPPYGTLIQRYANRAGVLWQMVIV